MPTGVAVASLDRFLSGADQIVILHLGLSRQERSQLERCVTNAAIEFHECEGLLHPSWIPPAHVTQAAFLRYLAAEILESSPRFVYLDGDVLVRQAPVALAEVDLQGKTLAAVQSRVTPYAASKGGVAAWQEIGIPSNAPYFNSGVLVVDAERWRQRGVTQSLTRYLELHGSRSNLADQEALNAAVVNDWVKLDRTWNYVTYVADYFLQDPEAEPASPAIAHYAGRHKPWLFGRAPLFADEWFEILRTTPWSAFTPPPPPSLKRSKILARRLLRAIARPVRSWVAHSLDNPGGR